MKSILITQCPGQGPSWPGSKERNNNHGNHLRDKQQHISYKKFLYNTYKLRYTELPTKDATVKTTCNSYKMTFPRFNSVLCVTFSLAYLVY